MMFFLYLGCFLLILYYLLTKNYNYWQFKGVPFDKPFFIFGSFYNVATGKENMFERIRSIYRQYSTPYVGIYFFNEPILIIRSPEIIKKILVKDFDKFSNKKVAANESADPIMFHSLFASKEGTWRNLRPKMTPVFSSGKMKLMFPLIQECAKNLITHLDKHNEKTAEFKAVMQKYTVDVISSCAFGINSYCLKDDDAEMMKIATQLLDPKSFHRKFSIFSYFFFPRLVDIFRLTFIDKKASDHLINTFKHTMQERKIKNIVRNDLIDLLSTLKKNETFDENYKFDDVKMAAQAIVFFTAGNDSTSSTISFALYELALNKEIQDRLRKEVKSAFEENEDISYEILLGLKYLDMVINETLRKYPATIFLHRLSTKNYTIEETGVTLEKNTPAFVPIVGLHYDPEYFPNPEKFDPERFNDENKHNIKPYTYMPFGEGPRSCMGQRFGILVSKIALAYVIKDFIFEVSEDTQIPLQFASGALFLQSKDGIKLRVVKI